MNSPTIRMDNISIVVESLDKAIEFFCIMGLTLQGRAEIKDEWAGRVTGVRDQQVEIAMLQTPDGHCKIELSKFVHPPILSDHRLAPVNSLGYLRMMFEVSDLDRTLERLYTCGASLVDEVVRYENSYRLCYIRGVEGLLIGLAEKISP